MVYLIRVLRTTMTAKNPNEREVKFSRNKYRPDKNAFTVNGCVQHRVKSHLLAHRDSIRDFSFIVLEAKFIQPWRVRESL